MLSDNEHFNSLIRLLLPTAIFDYFEIKDVEVGEKEISIHPCWRRHVVRAFIENNHFQF